MAGAVGGGAGAPRRALAEFVVMPPKARW